MPTIPIRRTIGAGGLILGGLLALGALTIRARAEPIEPAALDAAAEPQLELSSESDSDEAVGDGEGLLVMFNGNVFSGNILRTGNDFQVKSPTGTILVPGKAVKVHARDLEDACNILRKQIPAVGGENLRVQLARWCLTNKLTSQARQELKSVLASDADHEAARELLRKIDEVLAPAPKAKVEDKLKRMQQGLHLFDDPVTLAGMRREVGAEYARRIQPILMNSCALGGCHAMQGPSKLQLHRVRSDSAVRRLTEENMLTLVKYIDLESPDDSPLLTMPQQSHNLKGRPVFTGTTGDQLLGHLKDWVRQVAREQSGEPQKPAPTNRVSDQSEIADWDPKGTMPKKTAAPPRKKPAQSSTAVATEKAAPAKAKLSPGAEPDPFDPGAFNRGAP